MLDHLDLNVLDVDRSAMFYQRVLGRLGYSVRERHETWLILSPEDDAPYLTIVQTGDHHAASGFHRRRAGLNHLAFRAPDPPAVDAMHAWLVAAGIPVLYGGPIRMAAGRYAMFFEDPDRVKLEYVHRGDRMEP